MKKLYLILVVSTFSLAASNGTRFYSAIEALDEQEVAESLKTMGILDAEEKQKYLDAAEKKYYD